MTNSARLAVRISETRSTLNGLIEARNKLPDGKDPDADAIAKMDASTKSLQGLEVEYRAAIVTEQGEADEQETSEPDAQEKEIDKLYARASIVPFVMEAVEDRAVEGAEKELRAAALGEESAEAGRQFPVEMLTLPGAAGAVEHRADTVTPVAAGALADGGQAPVLPRVFNRSVASRLGVAMPAVPVGAHVYPIMTAGTTAAQVADSGRHDAGAGTFTGFTLEPIRLTAAYLFRVRQTLQLRNFEEILRRDLNAVMSDAMDAQILNGDGSAPNVSGFFDELPAAADDVTAVHTYQDYIGSLVSPIDGLNAFGPDDLRSIMGADTFKHMIGVYRTNNSEMSAWDRGRQLLGGLSVSGRIAAKTGGGIQTNVTALTSYPGRNAVAPIWKGMELIRDPYTKADTGEVRLTAVMYWNFKILREAGWHLWKTKVS